MPNSGKKRFPSLRAEAQQSGDPMHAQLVRDFEDTVNQFEKKIHDLKTSKTIAVQTAPQIKLIQNNDKLLADKIQTAIQETIPSSGKARWSWRWGCTASRKP